MASSGQWLVVEDAEAEDGDWVVVADCSRVAEDREPRAEGSASPPLTRPSRALSGVSSAPDLLTAVATVKREIPEAGIRTVARVGWGVLTLWRLRFRFPAHAFVHPSLQVLSQHGLTVGTKKLRRLMKKVACGR